MDDSLLFHSITKLLSADYNRLLLAANAYQCVLYAETTSSELKNIGSIEFNDTERAKLLDKTIRKKVFWLTTNDPENMSPQDAQSSIQVNSTTVSQWIKKRDQVTNGRNGEVSKATRDEVLASAAWRCQFEGCGEDLRTHFTSGVVKGNFSYFAHIIASSQDGPRGDALASPLLADDPTNILLLCDKCHRTIDRVAPHEYSVTRLRQMRESSIAQVKRALETLRYRKVKTIVLSGSIEGQSPDFDRRKAEEALWQSELRSDGEPFWILKQAYQISSVNKASFWSNAFEWIGLEYRSLRSYLSGTGTAGGERLPTAVFGVAMMSLMVLAGRIFGESSSIYHFQFHRDQSVDKFGGQWAWLADEEPKNTFSFDTLKGHKGEDSAVLLFFLTAKPEFNELPPDIYFNGEFQKPTVMIKASNTSFKCIRSKDDLMRLGYVIDDVVKLIQDEWRINNAQIIPLAPTTACFKLGQKMQARCQPEYTIYERSLADNREFEPILKITPTKAVCLAGSSQEEIQL
ncbi:hypothetical protein VCHE16_0114 [Vibrio paracholerae HE-16]|uniref:HNH endonuclease n=1 Tax=Gammaproteobacteria TaxID=1236 RepID=UPI00028EED43|nr:MULTISPECIES: SAVED domain-containing protein [Gammaproteobacteria]EKG91964.1 hypothetical protein VCHE16_0114 [Vibrio paracholerae HE-16]MBW5432261.1 SAVED domain-containing protein [Vibrio cholerae]MDH1626874.1 SAVED domain-containing protein [Shewanella xiamenensis]NAO20839.1 SAVED domain-containing protein [Vibrio cholerae]NAO58491.1 SAVED domain-containing protein [Vibrio cholerae]